MPPGWVIELMSANWSDTCASFVCISLMRMPGTLVETGLYGPRIVVGALGFMSHVSIWLGPPHSNTKMHDFSAATALPLESSLSLPITDPGIPIESPPIPAAIRACRRFISKAFMEYPAKSPTGKNTNGNENRSADSIHFSEQKLP